MHVLIIPDNYPTFECPQQGIFYHEQVQALRTQLENVNVMGGIPKTLSECFRTKNFKFNRLPSEKWLFNVPALRYAHFVYRVFAFSVGKKLFKKYIIENGLPDIIHVHNAFAGSLAVWIKQKYGIPYIITEHSSSMWNNHKKSNFIRCVYQNSSLNIGVSLAFSEHLTTKFGVEFEYIPNVVNTKTFRLKHVKHSRDIIRLASVGNLTVNKNHIVLLKAVYQLTKLGHKVSLTIGGEGPERNRLESFIAEHNLQKTVRLEGRLSQLGVVELLTNADYFVLPSLKETFGVVVIEAMSCGLPVLALKAGGPESIITSQQYGKIIANSNELQVGLLEFINTSYNSNIIRSYIEANFSMKSISDQLIAAYNRVLS